jgi:Carboxypeptidase regulatory-like domain
VKKTIFTAVLCIVTTALATWAQVDSATVTGTVRDSSGASLPNAVVTATEMNTGIKTTAKTSSDGNYVITPLKIGTYSVCAQATGFRTETRQNIVLNVEQNQRLDFQLQVGSVTQTAEVTSEAPLLESETASLGEVVAAPQVEGLPLNGRRYTDLGALTSGVAKVTEGPVNGGSTPTNGNAAGSFAVNGTRASEQLHPRWH